MIEFKNGLLIGQGEDKIDSLAGHAAGKRVVIHIHGGLVAAQDAIDNSTNLMDGYQSKGVYPVFPIWHTGLIETLQTVWPTILTSVFGRLLRERLMSTIMDLLPQAVTSSNHFSIMDKPEAAIVTKDHWRLVSETAEDFLVRRPDSELFEEFQKLKTAKETSDVELAANHPTLLPKVGESELINFSFVQDDGVQPAGFVDLFGPIGKFMKAVAKIVKAVAKRFINETDHGLQATIWEEVLAIVYIDTIGRDTWAGMKDGAKEACKTGKPMHRLLTQLQANNVTDVTFVAHSAGAIMICEMIDLMYGSLNWQHDISVVFLAPAVRTDRFQTTLVHKSKFKGFRSFTMGDDTERADVLTQGLLPDILAKAFYPSSLLYFISGVLEGVPDVPLVGMDRFLRKGAQGVAPIDPSVRQFLLLGDNTCFSPSMSANPKLQANSVHHGGFATWPLASGVNNVTMQSVMNIVADGVF